MFTDFFKQLKSKSSFLWKRDSDVSVIGALLPLSHLSSDCLTSTVQVKSEPSSRVTLACIILKLSGFLAGERVIRTPEDR